MRTDSDQESQPKVRIVVQARTDSTRLPGKALLPVAGIPSALLAALRAGNRGHDVILAIPATSSEDLLARTASRAGIQVCRGSRDDVLSRFLNATSDMDDQDILIRLTADNVFPDGELVDQLINEFLIEDTEYLEIDPAFGRAPWGLAAEVMRVGAIRLCDKHQIEPCNREHVTLFFQSRIKQRRPRKCLFTTEESVLRCTIDTLDDYLCVNRVFEKVADAVSVGWRELVARLACLHDAPKPFSVGPGLVLGTAQLASQYGWANSVHPPDVEEGIAMVRSAIARGAIAIDTARGYNGAENVIGKALSGGWYSRTEVVTKLSPLEGMSSEPSVSLVESLVEQSVLRSLRALANSVKPILLLHRASHLTAFRGAVWKKLEELCSEGLVAKLGVSVQTPEEACDAIANPSVKLIQLPLNVVDNRWLRMGIPERLRDRPDVTVHARSVFLQGLLLRPESQWPPVNGVFPREIINELNRAVTDFDRSGIADLCIAWARSNNWIHGLVIGMERQCQLEENLTLFQKPPLKEDEAMHLAKAFLHLPESLLTPSRWLSTSQF